MAAWRQSVAAWRQSVAARRHGGINASGGTVGGKAWRHGGKAGGINASGGKAWRHGGMAASMPPGGKDNFVTDKGEGMLAQAVNLPPVPLCQADLAVRKPTPHSPPYPLWILKYRFPRVSESVPDVLP